MHEFSLVYHVRMLFFFLFFLYTPFSSIFFAGTGGAMRKLIILALVLIGLIPARAYAQEVTTAWVVAGASSYAKAPGLPGVEDAEETCQQIVYHLLRVGYPAERVMNSCGPELVRTRFFVRLNEFVATQVPAGGTLVVIWLGHGGADPTTKRKVWATTDGSFDLYPGSDHLTIVNPGYVSEGITPDLLYGMTQRVMPTNAQALFVTDTARGGEFEAKGGTISLLGPSAQDFDPMPGVYALSPTPGKSVPAGITAKALASCIVPSASTDGTPGLTARELISCYISQLSSNGVTTQEAGNWEGELLITFPEKAGAAKTPPPLLPG
ncbi:hypothetical protein EBT25_05870, partial [bacterium]|nr:hypothetical protein [bacterium]